jgi:Fic family protein
MPKKNKGETSYQATAFGIIGRSELIPLEIEGIKKAWDFVIKKSEKGNISITPALLKEVHKIGFGWILPEIGGKLRTIEVKVSKHTPPKHYLIPQLLEDFTKDLKIRLKHLPKLEDDSFLDKLIELLAWAHHRFLWIHPFTDYNGRISRLLSNIILINLNLPPIELKVETPKTRGDYVNALQKADSGHYQELEKLFSKAITESIKEYEEE